MYADYLGEFRRFVFLLGEDDITGAVKAACDANPDKTAVVDFYCCKKLNLDYKKPPGGAPSRNSSELVPAGKILKSYWINKVLKKEPPLIVMVFNMAKPLDPIEKIEDRLATADAEIRSTREFLRSQDSRSVLNFLFIVGNQSTQLTIDKTKEYMKISDRSMQFTTADAIKAPNEVKRLRSIWLHFWEKTLEEALKKKQRSLEESTRDQAKLNCNVKIAILSDLMGKDNALTAYENAYFLCRKMYATLERNRAQQLDILIPQFEYRAIADVLLIRIVHLLSKSKPVECVNRVSLHFMEMSNKGFPHFMSEYLYYEQLNWKSNYLETVLKQLMLLTVVNTDRDKQKFCEFLEGMLSYRIGLINLKYEQANSKLEREPQAYFGRLCYRVDTGQKIEDLKETRLLENTQSRQSIVMDSLGVIAWIRDAQNLLRPYQLQLLKMNQLRFYLAICRFFSDSALIDEAITLYDEIVVFYINRRDYYILNHLLKEIQDILKGKEQRNNLITFHLISLRIADHFQSRDHITSFMKHLKDTLQMFKAENRFATVSHPLPRNSLLVRVRAAMGPKMLSLSEKRVFKLELEMDPCVNGFFDTLDVEFSIDTKKKFHGLPLQKALQLEFEPSDFTLQEEMLQIKSVVFRSSQHHIEAICRTNEIEFKKEARLFLSMPVVKPVIIIKALHGQDCYTNEVVPVSIHIAKYSV